MGNAPLGKGGSLAFVNILTQRPIEAIIRFKIPGESATASIGNWLVEGRSNGVSSFYY